ncbi:DUF4282 domain-containing protein [Brachybacterium sp. JHP9]|uniref:DUF4282 domain-containing protein n=1 Tax=Brachybacterium equifaecis TaxID=2910770 RepID=A0ABT0R5I7_9MICO|nr:DUF4282 domain-containing protein [Brachybacterium equifaecis]MCL6424180.1 DUF4282 domain-containing protein [Brachybacterium equifaecis]
MTQSPYTQPEPHQGSSAAPRSEGAPAAPFQDPWGASSTAQSPAAPASDPAVGAYGTGYPGSPSAGTHTGGQPTGAGTTAKGFFGAIFDFSFRHFVTIRFVQVFYIIGIAWAILNYVGGLIMSLIMGAGMSYYDDFSIWPFLLYLVFGWIFPVLTILLLRVGLEFVVATIRTSQNTTEIVDQLKTRG